MSSLPLVSIITPCYNGESFIDRYFESILHQTYTNLELIFINDGSSDRTEDMALSYRDALEARGIRYTYIYQENKGQAAAMNQGLSVFRGTYLTWPDSDDFMTPDCIEKKVAYLEAHPEKGMVQCRSAVVKEGDLHTVLDIVERKNVRDGHIFEGLMFENDAPISCGSYMVRTDVFLKAIPTRHIYECATGQNWQMLLPVAYSAECGFLSDIMYYIVIRQNSHSRAEQDYASNIEKTFRHEDTLVHILAEMSMPEEEREAYLKQVEMKYVRKRMQLSAKFHQIEALKENYQILSERHVLTGSDRVFYWRQMIPPFDVLMRVVDAGRLGVTVIYEKIKRRLDHDR